MRRDRVRAVNDIKLFTRDHEMMLFVTASDAGRCGKCGKDLAEGMFCWDHRITDGMIGEWKLGEDRFTSVRPADGSQGCHGAFTGFTRDDGSIVPASESYYCFSMPRCPECRQYNSLNTRQEAYGDDVTCTECGWHAWYSIGD